MSSGSFWRGLVQAVEQRRIEPFEKGLGRLPEPLTSGDARGLGWSLLDEQLSLPVAVLYESRLTHNLQFMQEFARRYQMKLAPHGKTTMAPALFRRQLEAGAWGITVATAQQAAVAAAHGVPRILMANQLVGRRNCELVADALAEQTFEFFCLVDSVEGAEQLGRFFAARGQRVNVLLELGVAGGRTGIRSDAARDQVLRVIREHSASVTLAGVELYEGVLSDEAEIRAFLQHAVRVTLELLHAQHFERDPPLLSGAGSAWYDVVAEEFSEAARSGVEIVLRPGCYLTHDAGIYGEQQARIAARNPVAKAIGCGLLPAMQVWAYAQSLPEPGLAIVGMGKRDVAFDAGLPQPVLHYRPGAAAPQSAGADWQTVRLMDQHAFVEVGAADVRVGDMLAFDISHPCLTFDKWRVVPIVNDEYRVIDLLPTYF